MVVWATTKLTQDFAGTTAAARIQADVLVLEPSPAVRLDQDFDGSAALIQPRLQLEGQPAGTGADYPAVIASWTVDGVDPGALLEGDLVVGSDLEACSETWTRPIIASTGGRRTGDHQIGPLGYEVTRGGPPPGPGVPISFSLRLRGTGDLVGTNADLPLLTGGFVERAPRAWNKKTHIMTLSGSGGWVLYKDLEIDIDLPADHGLTQGQIAIQAMEAAGVPDELIGIDPTLGAPRRLPQKIRCIGLQAVLKELFRPIGYVPMAGRTDGVFRAVPLFVEDVSLVTITTVDIVHSEGLEVGSDATKPTCFVIEGRRLQDTGAGPGSGIVTVRVVARTIDPSFINPIAQSFQDTAGNIILTGFSTPAPVPNHVTSQTTVETTTDDGCLILTFTQIKQYFNPTVSRFIANSSTVTGQPFSYPTQNVFFFDVTPAQDDATEAVQWIQPRFVIFSEVSVEPQYNNALRKVGVITRSNAWKQIGRRIKSRGSQADPWEAQNYEPGNLSAGGDGQVFFAEQFFIGPGAPDNLLPSGTSGAYPGIRITTRHTEVVTVVDEVDECDFIPSTATSTTTYGRRKGRLQLWTDGEHRDDKEVGVTSTTTSLRITAGGVTQLVQTAVDTEGRQLPGPAPSVIDGVPGAEICTPDALLQEIEQILSVRVCLERSDGSEDLSKTIDLSSRWVETVAEAEFWGSLELTLARGYPLQVTMASPAPIIAAGDTVEIDIPEILPGVSLVKVLETETTIPPATGAGVVVHQLRLLIPPTGLG